MQKNNILNSPPGMKSYLSDSTGEFIEIREKINEIFKIWGYTPIMTPLLEYYDSLLTGMGQHTRKEFYKMIDYDGNILALRPEMTAPIARTIANRIDDLTPPLRLSYFAPVYRYDSPQVGKYREIYQMGLEFIGNNCLADAEVIIIAIEAIKNTGIKNFKIDLGHTGYLDGIINEMQLTTGEAAKLKLLLNKKDFVGIEEYVKNLDTKNIDFTDISRLRGNEEVLTRADKLVSNKESRQALEELRILFEQLKKYNVAENVNFDLSLNRGLNYYTGIVFEGFTGKLGYTICGGGRYDNLLHQYGAGRMPAVGFAIGIERLRIALQNQRHKFNNESVDVIVVYKKGGGLALEIAKMLHKKKVKTTLVEDTELEKYISKCRKKNIKKIISLLDIKENKITFRDIKAANKKDIIIKEGWQEKLWKVW